MLPASLETRSLKGMSVKWLASRLRSVIQVILMLMVVQVIARAEGEVEVTERKILFRLYLPDASKVKTVEVIGDFNSWRRGSTPLQGPDSRGKWEAAVILKSNVTRVEYIYLVDGQRFLDSKQARIADDFGSDNHILIFHEAAQGFGGADAVSASD